MHSSIYLLLIRMNWANELGKAIRMARIRMAGSAPARGALGYKFLRGGTLFVDGGAGERSQDELDEAYYRGDPQKPVRKDGQRPVDHVWKKVADHPISEGGQHGGPRTRTEASARSRIEPNGADADEEAPHDEDGNCARRHVVPEVLHGCGAIRGQDSAVGDIFENVNDDPRHDPTCNDAAPIDFSHGLPPVDSEFHGRSRLDWLREKPLPAQQVLNCRIGRGPLRMGRVYDDHPNMRNGANLMPA